MPIAEELRSRDRSWPWIWAPIGALTILVYLAIHLLVVRHLPGALNVHLAQPALWSYLALMAYLLWKYGVTSKPVLDRSMLILAGLLGAFGVALSVLAGLLLGFGSSPYGHQIATLLGNALFVTPQLMAIEMGRACVIISLGARRPALALSVTTLFFSLVSIPLVRLSTLAPGLGLLRFSGETLLPLISQNLLASFLALLGGPLPALVYRGVMLGFEWLSPFLPDLEWIASAFIGTMAPALGLLILHSRMPHAESDEVAVAGAPARSPAPWTLLAALAVTALFFNTGLLGVTPTLISGVSMHPTMKTGDVAISIRTAAARIQVGDIVRFRTGEADVLHRVVEIQGGSYEPVFITRGDSNNVNDPPLAASDVEGKVIMVIPQLGWVSILARRAIEGVGLAGG